MPAYTRADLKRLDTSLQVRVKMDRERVQRFATLYLAGQDLPPVTVYDTDTGMVLTDGYHRLAAFRQIAREPDAPERLPYVVHSGTRAEARLHALSANDSGSLPLTPADRIYNAIHLWREHRITYPAAQQRAAGLVLSPDEQYEVARQLWDERAAPTWDVLGEVVGRDGSTVYRWLQRGYAGKRQKPDKRRQVVTTLQRLADLTDAVGKQSPRAWARALIAEHVEAYANPADEPPDLRAIQKRLRVLANMVEARADEYEAPHRQAKTPPDA